VSRDTLLCWIHPALGFVAVGLAVRAAGLGFGARRASRSAPAARAGRRERGATAVLLAGVQVFLGLQIMPH